MRDELMHKDRRITLGANLTLTAEEEIVNAKLTSMLRKEMDADFNFTAEFTPAHNFMIAKPVIDASEVYQFVRGMPKGAILHSHDSSLTSLDWVVKNLTYWDNLYFCDLNDSFTFKFLNHLPEPAGCPNATWRPISEARAEAESPESFDEYLLSTMSLYTPHPEKDYPDINKVWEKFGKYFMGIGGLLDYRDAMKAYLYRAMEEMLADGVTYFEFRGVLSGMTRLDGSQVSKEDMVGEYKDTVEQFKRANPDFQGCKFIFAPQRDVDISTVWQHAALARPLMELYPDFVAGFDLVGQEDKGKPLLSFIEPLLNISAQGVPFFFHAGETNWYGEPTDLNLLDALLLNTTRIGHGYALEKHPDLLQMARERDVPIEVNPISNQVLMLVKDLRNHPAAGWAASNQPLVVSSDDAAAWGATLLSHDFYLALLSFGGRDADLRFLKQLALNSITYCSLAPEPKAVFLEAFNLQWREWIHQMAQSL